MSLSPFAPCRKRILSIILFSYGVLVLALPVVLPTYLPTQDGGAHYNTAVVLNALETDPNGFYGRYFEMQQSPLSNQLAAIIISRMIRLGLGNQSERILWLVIFSTFSFIVVYNLSLIREKSVLFSFLMFPISAGSVVNLGFLNYMIGLLIFIQTLFVLRYGLRKPSLVWLSGLVGFSLITYFAHPLAAFSLGATEGSLAVGYVLLWPIASRRNAALSFSILVPIGCALGCVALAALAAHDAWPQIARLFDTVGYNTAVGSEQAAFASTDTLRERLIFIFGISYIVNYSPLEYVFSVLLAVLIGLLVVRQFLPCGIRAFRLEDVWIAPAILLLLLCILVPRSFEFYLPERIVPCIFAVLTIWLAESELDRAGYGMLISLGLIVNTGLFLDRLEWSSHIDSILQEYSSVSRMIPDDVSVLSIETGPSYLQTYCRAIRPRRLPCGFRPTLHFIGEALGDRPIALLTNYQLLKQAGFFPVGLRAPWNTYTDRIADFSRWPPPPPNKQKVIAEAVRAISRLPPEVIVTWDERLATGGTPALDAETMGPLLDDYVKVFTSEPIGAASVYLRVDPRS